MSATTTGEKHIRGQALVGQLVVPKAAHPDDMVAAVVGETDILAAVFAHVLVDNGAHTTLVIMVAVEVGDAFLNQAFGFCKLGIGWGESAVLVLNGEVHFPVLVERPSMVIVPPYLGNLPGFDGFNIFLCFRHQ